jgi:hypothetical protein
MFFYYFPNLLNNNNSAIFGISFHQFNKDVVYKTESPLSKLKKMVVAFKMH